MSSDLMTPYKTLKKNNVGKKLHIGARPGFRPCGPIREMLRNELRTVRSQTKIFENCIVGHLGAKYPELAKRFWILRQEKEGK